MAAYTELYMDQGSTFSKVIYLDDDITNANINIAGYSVQSQMRRSYYSENAAANLVCTISDSSNGEITITLDSANTSNIKHGTYLFDVKITSDSDITTKILEGLIIVAPGITK